MKTLYHGTTLDNYRKIMENGFGREDKDTVWNCSNPDETYFYELEKLMTEDNEPEDAEHECIQECFGQAKIAAAAQEYLGKDLVVMKLIVPDDICEDDYSCENMADRATCVCNSDLKLEYIQKVYILRNGYNPAMRLFYVAGLIDYNQYFNSYNFTKEELSICKKIAYDFFEETLYDDDWEELTEPLTA